MTNQPYPAITAIQATITRAAHIEAARSTLTDAEWEQAKHLALTSPLTIEHAIQHTTRTR